MPSRLGLLNVLSGSLAVCPSNRTFGSSVSNMVPWLPVDKCIVAATYPTWRKSIDASECPIVRMLGAVSLVVSLIRPVLIPMGAMPSSGVEGTFVYSPFPFMGVFFLGEGTLVRSLFRDTLFLGLWELCCDVESVSASFLVGGLMLLLVCVNVFCLWVMFCTFL